MPIDVTCAGCKTRFQVSDKFAGKKGPCPKCKSIIQVPEKSQEVVVHAPEHSGPKDSKGRAVLKPLQRQDARMTPTRIAILVGSILLVLGGAVALRMTHPLKKVEARPASPGRPALQREVREVPVYWLALGAVALAPVLAWSGYSFLRDDELEPLSGKELWVRTAICATAYAALWGVYFGLKVALGVPPGAMPDPIVAVIAVGAIAAAGAGVGFASMNLTFGTGAVHFAFYLVVTVLLRLVVGLNPL
ncbi:MAG: hypothetical protein U0939_25120 [Pirellulales bacterium]